MITFSFLKQTRYRVAILVSVFGAILVLASLLDGAYEDYGVATDYKLGLQHEMNFPLREISGLYLSPKLDADGGRELLVIGDHAPSLGVGTLVGQDIANKHQIDFSNAIMSRFGVCDSKKIVGCEDLVKDLTTQWEAIAADASGKVFLLHEQLASIFVYDRGSERIVSLINLESFEIDPDRQRKKVTIDQENALGEGFVLLKNGHILVVKERFKPSIVEFGLPGEQAQGYRPELWGDGQFEFPLTGEQISMVPLKIWNLADKHRQCDLAELTTDAQGELYLLSQQCQWVAKVKTPLELGDDEMDLATVWGLPNKIKNAEAMLIVDDHTFLVGEDKKSLNKNNLFMLTLKNDEPRLAGH